MYLYNKIFDIKYRYSNYTWTAYWGLSLIFIYTNNWHYMKKRIFVLRKFVKRAGNIIFSLVFVCSRFTEISYFLSFPSNENVWKQHLSGNAYFCVNMKFSYWYLDILMSHCHKSKQFISEKMGFSVVLQREQVILQLFVEDIHIFWIISFKKCDRKIVDLIFFSFEVIKIMFSPRSFQLTC